MKYGPSWEVAGPEGSIRVISDGYDTIASQHITFGLVPSVLSAAGSLVVGETVAEINIRGPKGSRTIHAVVDTGATNTVVSKELADALGIVTARADEVVLADGSIDKVGVGSAEVEIQGIRQVVPVYIYKGTLIGLTTLEAAGFRVNPVTQTLEKVPGRLLRVAWHETRESCGGSGGN